MTARLAPYEQSISFFHAQDLKATTTFYEQLGLPLKLDQGPCRIFQVSRDGFIGFCTHQQPAAAEGVIITQVQPGSPADELARRAAAHSRLARRLAADDPAERGAAGGRPGHRR